VDLRLFPVPRLAAPASSAGSLLIQLAAEVKPPARAARAGKARAARLPCLIKRHDVLREQCAWPRGRLATQVSGPPPAPAGSGPNAPADSPGNCSICWRGPAASWPLSPASCVNLRNHFRPQGPRGYVFVCTNDTTAMSVCPCFPVA